MADTNQPAPSKIGAPIDFIVERGAVERFAAAAQSTSPEHRGDDAIIHPTFLMSVAQWMNPEDRVQTGFDRARVLHGSQEFRYVGEPPRAGARLTAQERIVDRFEKEGRRGGLMRFAVVETEFRDAHSRDLVASMRMTVIERAAS
ncbi:FAS1-like dehydratase domain-containing protein [Microbacterium immunditiarum]|uniref:FAS1-like dehydratase domain-containing protein n=1 Tax=Microbacterium immunditiarum TaxID=337480 RepID=A0A7Y9GNP5_9MICO|nr:MaoC family dehydratase N-terminal domain-containing protein [Microbacterium immunditiarum]NYE19646.1 hypothetical protein [Microbacterium immunditiarum]